MKLSLQKVQLAFMLLNDRMAGILGNYTTQQNMVEKIVLLHTQMRVEKEQAINKTLFSNF